MNTDPLADVVTMLQPAATRSKLVSGAGSWRVRRAELGQPFYCAILDGASRLAVEGQRPMVLERGDFVLVPAAFRFTASSLLPPRGSKDSTYTVLPDGEVRHGDVRAAPDVRMLIGYCAFGSPDAGLLVSLLPDVVHVRGERRLALLVELVREEFQRRRPAREVVLARLLEVLLIEALRASGDVSAPPGLLRGLADEQLGVAIRAMHAEPTNAWTVPLLARRAGLSRTTFFERFRQAVGVTPIDYLLGWRMALAKQALRRDGKSVAEVAVQVGYGSASTFSVAFTRHVGLPPSQYARSALERGTESPTSSV